MQNKKTYLIISEINDHGGGKIYAKKNLDYFFSDYEVFELNNRKNLVAFANKIYNSRFANLIFRLPFMVIFKYVFIKILGHINSKSFIKDHANKQINFIIAYTEDLLSIEIAQRISKEMGLTFHLIAMDFPWTYKNSAINNYLIKKLFFSRLQEIKSAEFVSDEMQNIAQNKGFKGKSFVSYSAMDLLVQFKGASKSNKSITNLVYAGSPRFKKELKLFYDLISIKEQEKRLKIHIYSECKLSDLIFNHHEFITNQNDLIKAISQYDVGLIPMSFNKKDRDLVATSFPSKASTYISAGLPILAIAPEYSAISRIVKQYELGEVINFNNPEKINDVLRSIQTKDYSKNLIAFRKLMLDRFKEFKQDLLKNT